jgi:hypothetical protein
MIQNNLSVYHMHWIFDVHDLLGEIKPLKQWKSFSTETTQ